MEVNKWLIIRATLYFAEAHLNFKLFPGASAEMNCSRLGVLRYLFFVLDD